MGIQIKELDARLAQLETILSYLRSDSGSSSVATCMRLGGVAVAVAGRFAGS